MGGIREPQEPGPGGQWDMVPRARGACVHKPVPHEQAGKAARECEVWLWTEARTVGGADESH